MIVSCRRETPPDSRFRYGTDVGTLSSAINGLLWTAYLHYVEPHSQWPLPLREGAEFGTAQGVVGLPNEWQSQTDLENRQYIHEL